MNIFRLLFTSVGQKRQQKTENNWSWGENVTLVSQPSTNKKKQKKNLKTKFKIVLTTSEWHSTIIWVTVKSSGKCFAINSNGFENTAYVLRETKKSQEETMKGNKSQESELEIQTLIHQRNLIVFVHLRHSRTLCLQCLAQNRRKVVSKGWLLCKVKTL